jgi:hypothetical protein
MFYRCGNVLSERSMQFLLIDLFCITIRVRSLGPINTCFIDPRTQLCGISLVFQ